MSSATPDNGIHSPSEKNHLNTPRKDESLRTNGQQDGSSGDDSSDSTSNAVGDIKDHTSGDKKLGMVRTTLIFFTNQVGIGILTLPSVLHTIGLIPGIISIIAFGCLATYTAYILIQFWRKYPAVRDIVDVGRIMGGLPLEIIVGIAHVLNLALISASANVTLSIGLNTMTNHALCTVGFVGIPMIMCWLLCMPRSLSFAGWFGIPATISIFVSVLIVIVALAVNGPNTTTTGYFSEPAAEPLTMTLGPNPLASMNQQFEAVLNVAFAYAGNQAFITVIAEMRNPNRDYPRAIIWLNVFAVPMYTIAACVIYYLAGQYVVSPALGSAPGLPSKVAYGILFGTMLGSGLVYGHTAIKYLFIIFMERVLKSKHTLMDGSEISWSVWLGIGTVFWLSAFVLANAIPAFNSILAISSALFVTWFTFGLSAAQWLFINWGQTRKNWKKICLASFNWFLIAASIFLTIFGLYTSISGLAKRVADPNDSLNVFTCADNSLF